MPRQIAKLIGGPGTSKTRSLLELMELAVHDLGSAMEVGFTTYLRAARREASERAASLFGESVHVLEHEGWFRTLHSICYHCLGVSRDELLANDKSSREWLEDALQEPVTPPSADGDEYGHLYREGSQTDAERALAIWATARNRLEPLEAAWRRIDECDDRTPPLDRCLAFVGQYELAKRAHGRLDFTDLLGRFSGWYFHPAGHESQKPEGEPPDVAAWFVDEAQDFSLLKSEVVARLAADVRWLYLVGDPFQSIFGYEGGDPGIFLEWPSDKTRVMPRSYRCAAEILALGERLISSTAGYWDRKIEPAALGGEVEDDSPRRFLAELDAAEDWLILARTRLQAAQIGRWLHDEAIPWSTVKGDKTAPVRQLAIQGFLAIQDGAPLDGAQWQAIMRLDKQSGGGVDALKYLQRGTKTWWLKQQDVSELSWIMPDDLLDETYGATPAFMRAVRAGTWRDWVRDADWYPEAERRWGIELCERPRVRLGTVHAAKGREADNVAVLTTVTRQCAQSAQSDEGRDEEARVKYVAVTRARKRLVLLRERAAYRWRME